MRMVLFTVVPLISLLKSFTIAIA
jgi:hypothetical protein